MSFPPQDDSDSGDPGIQEECIATGSFDRVQKRRTACYRQAEYLHRLEQDGMTEHVLKSAHAAVKRAQALLAELEEI